MLIPPYRILLADDHAILRAGLRLFLNSEPDIEVVGEASDGYEAVRKASQLQPDIVLLDLAMPGMDGLAALQELKKSAASTCVLVLTMHEDKEYLKRALEAGASGYLLKKAVDTELLSAIRSVARDEIYVHPAMTKFLIEGAIPNAGVTQDTNKKLWQELSERERQIVTGIVFGYTSEEIAKQHSVSVKTVYTYRSRAMTKLGLENRAQLVDLAVTLGLFDR